MARSTSVGALLVRAVGVRLPISDPASHAAIRRRELLEETRTLFASATVCSRGGKGLRGGCPPNKCFAGDAVVRLEVFRFAPLTTPCHGNLETPTIHAHSRRA